ncbi:uncharacterized protein LOC107359318 [Tetranychus urticae]|uniref:Uncharacterized protein n=1 Tax=Tetranychus urticae TaxID=32264 RepID=T1K0R2_TETUR|nr:uncharacterized protein LOC107359318 [Tetranychus urticae]
MILIPITGLLTLTVAVSGNFFGSSFPGMSNFGSVPSFQSPFGSNDPFGFQPSFSGFNSFPSPSFQSLNIPDDFSSSENSGNKVTQTIKVEKSGPEGEKITETIETLGGPNGGSTVKINRQSSSSVNSGSNESTESNPIKLVHVHSSSGSNRPSASTQGIAVGEPYGSSSVDHDSNNDGNNNQFEDLTSSYDNGGNVAKASRFNNFGFYPTSAGLSSIASAASNSNFASSTSTRTNPDGSTVTETVTYDSKNPGKVSRVTKRVDRNGKVTITRS